MGRKNKNKHKEGKCSLENKSNVPADLPSISDTKPKDQEILEDPKDNKVKLVPTCAKDVSNPTEKLIDTKPAYPDQHMQTLLESKVQNTDNQFINQWINNIRNTNAQNNTKGKCQTA